MQGFRKSSAWRWSVAQHQKEKKNGRYYHKHRGLSLLLQWLWCSARGARGEEFTVSEWELLWGSSGWFLQLSPDLEGFSITKNWGWPWVWSPQGWAEAAHQPCAAQGFQKPDPRRPQGDGSPHPATDWSSEHWMGKTAGDWQSRICWAPGTVCGGGCTGDEMRKLSRPFLSGIASRNSSNNNSLLFPFLTQHSVAEAMHANVWTVVTALRYLILRLWRKFF